MKKKLSLICVVFVATVLVSSVTAASEPLDGLARAIHSAVVSQLTVAGLAAPTIAQLSTAIIKHYGPDPNVVIRNLYDRLQGSQNDFEADLTKLLETIYTGVDVAKFKTQIVDKGGIKLTEGLRPLRISAVEDIPRQTLDDWVRAFTRGISNSRDDTPAWDTQFDEYVRKMNELYDVNWSKAELAARTLADQTGLSVATVLDPTQQGVVQTAINQASPSLQGFLDAAQRVVIKYPLVMLDETKRKLEQAEQARDKLAVQLTKAQQELGLLRQEMEGFRSQRNLFLVLLILTVALAAGAGWLAIRRGRSR